jgi:FkbM family methyltransferase
MQYGKYYETGMTENTAIILSEIGKDQIFVDVGMNIGWFSLYALAMGAQEHAFEPNPVNRLRFCESAIASNFPANNIYLHGSAVRNTTGDLVLTHVRGKPGAARFTTLDNVPSKSKMYSHHVKLVRLDDIAEQQGWLRDNGPKISLMKVNVEGHDPQVLFGAERLRGSRNVENVFMEYSCTMAEDDGMKKATDILAASGYTISMIGNWQGKPMQNGEAKVLGSGGKGEGRLSERLQRVCKEENLKKRGALQLNMW